MDYVYEKSKNRDALYYELIKQQDKRMEQEITQLYPFVKTLTMEQRVIVWQDKRIKELEAELATLREQQQHNDSSQEEI